MATPIPRAAPRAVSCPAQVVLNPVLDPGLDLRALAKYSSLSVSLLRLYVNRPVNALPAHRFGAKITVTMSDWHAFRAQFRRVGSNVEERLRTRRKKRRATLGVKPKQALRVVH